MKQTVEEAAIAAVHDFYGCTKCSYRTNCIYCGGTDSPSDCDANTFYAGFKKGAKWRESQIPEHISTVQDCELAVRVTKEKAIEAFRKTCYFRSKGCICMTETGQCNCPSFFDFIKELD